jgi:hypothetical protein
LLDLGDDHRHDGLVDPYWNFGDPMVLVVTLKTVLPFDAWTVPTVDFPLLVRNSMWWLPGVTGTTTPGFPETFPNGF